MWNRLMPPQPMKPTRTAILDHLLKRKGRQAPRNAAKARTRPTPGELHQSCEPAAIRHGRESYLRRGYHIAKK
jgi:hypothetical protein